MSPTFTSTVPGAVSALTAHFQNVATANSDLSLAIYLGPPLNAVANNFISIGNPEGEGAIITNYQTDFQGYYQSNSLRRTESYGIHCWLRTQANSVDQLGRLTDAMRVINSITSELAGDIHGSDALSPSGEWELTDIENIANGPFNGVGWGCLFELSVQVKNVILTAT